MARAPSAKVVLNRKALDALAGSFADALGDMGKAFLDVADPPDAAPFGVGLVTSGDWGVWAGSKKVDGTAAKPRAVRLDRKAVTLVAGFGFPGRFQETGTVHQPARPFATPALMQVIPGSEAFFRRRFREIASKFR